jgi:solute:Na+ symporter, SSS family
MIGGIFFAYITDDIFVVFKYVLSIGTIIGPAIWLVYFWRRLTTKAVVTQMLLSILVTVVVPNLVPAFKGARTAESLMLETEGRSETVMVSAKEDDVKTGAATKVGDQIEKINREDPVGVYYETVVRQDPSDPSSRKEGKGIFKFQLWLIGLMGVDLASFSKAALSTASFGFDIIFPFVVLFIVSLFTRRNDESVLRDFYARVHTPAQADPELDRAAVEKKIANPDLVEQDKIFPGTDWEFWKPTRKDILGFVACWIGVLAIIGLYVFVMNIGK